MADRLTQLQDAVNQLALQFVASIHYVNAHHDYQALGPNDRVQVKEPKDGEPEPREVEPHSEEEFKASQRELAQDLILREQQIEYLISVLPGLENSEKDQEETIQKLEGELKVAEERRKDAMREKEVVLARLEGVIRSVKRP